jgi:uncharacterized membrane protein YdcZ (DUF606 family)
VRTSERSPVTAVYLLIALAVGLGSAVQIAMIGSMARDRGSVEAAWVSLLATVAGVAVVLAIRALAGHEAALPQPFDKPLALLGAAALSAIALVVSVRGLDIELSATGLWAVPFLVGAGFIGPRLGIAVFFVAAVTGQIVGSVAVDHVGAFGAQVHRVNAARIVGIAFMLAGLVIVERSR